MVEKINLEKYKEERTKIVKEIVATETIVNWNENNLEISIPTNGEVNLDETETRLVGGIKTLENEKVAGTNDNKFFYLEDIRVQPVAQGNEVALLLLEQLVIELDKKNIKHIFGVARDGNALALFAKAFGKNNLILYDSQYKPTRRSDISIDNYINKSGRLATYIDFGVDITILEAAKTINTDKGKKFKRLKMPVRH